MLKRLSLNLINIYQRYIRVTLSVSCRFSPTCSEYTKQAILKYGFFKGGGKAVKRLLLCHPFSGKAGDYPLD
ncbi:MAG: membrane protein insertion efficiency factor YidD [Candidatus Omnitrophica bacterium]|nr:membrane protein insertion efficiency factor YidD [Candidatus Omnitrophota bacterium]MDD5238593.1 membrane protein insertion efficiency factor YidD [Candidatus Omnitrophota bacterium]